MPPKRSLRASTWVEQFLPILRALSQKRALCLLARYLALASPISSRPTVTTQWKG